MEENKNNRKKIIIITIICITTLLLGVGILFKIIDNDDKPKTNTEDKKTKEEKLAKSILTTLNIDDYLSFVFYPTIEVNKNILDITSNKNMILYFLADENVAKYKLTDGNNAASLIVKYDDYLTEHKKVFGVEPNIEANYKDFIFAVPNLPNKINSNYQININDIIDCDTTKSNNCFIILANAYDNSDRVEFSNLSIKNNVIESNVRLYSKEGEAEVYLDGKFKFEFEKNGDNYIAKSLIITYAANAYNQIINE